MSIEEASDALNAKLDKYDWFFVCGVGEGVLYVYTFETVPNEREFLASGWEGYPVVFRDFGGPVKP